MHATGPISYVIVVRRLHLRLDQFWSCIFEKAYIHVHQLHVLTLRTLHVWNPWVMRVKHWTTIVHSIGQSCLTLCGLLCQWVIRGSLCGSAPEEETQGDDVVQRGAAADGQGCRAATFAGLQHQHGHALSKGKGFEGAHHLRHWQKTLLKN